jgi:DNA-binding beta-propeller fold protein YncE
LIGEGTTLRILSASRGTDLARIEFDQPILMARQVGAFLYVLMDIEGIGAVRRYELTNNDARLIKSTPVNTRYPRGIDYDASGLYVADTFNHRVIRLDPYSLELQAEAASFFPNSVQVTGDRLLVTEEHLNVVSEFRMQPLQRLGPRIGCSAQPAGVQLPDDTSGRLCGGVNPIATLYSPNDAVAVGGHVYVADTDHHRVVEMFEGHIISELSGFNNPINVRVALH